MVSTRKVRGEDRERPYRVESWVVGARACLPSACVCQKSHTDTIHIHIHTKAVPGMFE